MTRADGPAPTEAAEPTGAVLRRIGPLLVITFALFWSVGVALPLVPVAIVDDLGGTKADVGLAVAAIGLGGLLGRVVGGVLTDTFGGRLPMRVGMGLMAVAGLAMIRPSSVEVVIGARLLQGVSEAVTYTAGATLLVENVPAARRARFLSFNGSAVWGGLTLGPALGESLGSLPAGGVVVLVSCVVALVASFRAPERTFRPSGRVRVRFPRVAWVPGLVIGLYNFGYTAVTGFLILHLRDRGINPAWALTTYGVSVACGRLALGGLPDRLGPRPSLAVGLSGLAASLTVVAWAPSRLVVLIGLAVFGVCYSLPFPAIATLTIDRARPDERASALATLNAVYDVLALSSGVAFGWIADAAGTGSVMAAAVGGIGASLAVALLVVAPRRGTGPGHP